MNDIIYGAIIIFCVWYLFLTHGTHKMVVAGFLIGQMIGFIAGWNSGVKDVLQRCKDVQDVRK